MAIVRIYTGPDGKSHFEDIEPAFTPRDDRSEQADAYAAGGIVIRRFDAKRSNSWHNAPGRYCVFNVSGAVDIEIGDGSVRRLGPGDILMRKTSRARGT